MTGGLVQTNVQIQRSQHTLSNALCRRHGHHLGEKVEVHGLPLTDSDPCRTPICTNYFCTYQWMCTLMSFTFVFQMHCKFWM